MDISTRGLRFQLFYLVPRKGLYQVGSFAAVLRRRQQHLHTASHYQRRSFEDCAIHKHLFYKLVSNKVHIVKKMLHPPPPTTFPDPITVLNRANPAETT